jgi:hypothetical protein
MNSPAVRRTCPGTPVRLRSLDALRRAPRDRDDELLAALLRRPVQNERWVPEQRMEPGVILSGRKRAPT